MRIAAPNVLRFNREGIRVLVDASNTTFFANDYSDNDNLGIDLCASSTCPDGITANDVDDADSGGNNLQNAPVLTTARLVGGSIIVDVSLDVPAGFATQRDFLALYASATCDVLARGEGAAYLGSVGKSITNATEAFSISLVGSAPLGSQITATASFLGNTSEFSNCVTLVEGDSVFANSFE